MKSTNFRRVPKQSRSQERYDAILDTAANLFIEKSFTLSTTNEIARRADMSIGSLYQYFHNKEAIADALTERYVEVLSETTTRVVAENPQHRPTVAASVDSLVDPILAFHAEHPAFRTLWLESDVSPELRSSMRGMDDALVRHITALMEARLPTLTHERAHMMLITMQLAVKSLIAALGHSQNDVFKASVVAETKRMLTAYIEDVIREHE